MDVCYTFKFVRKFMVIVVMSTYGDTECDHMRNLSHITIGVVWEVGKIMRLLPFPFVCILKGFSLCNFDALLDIRWLHSLKHLKGSSNSKLVTLPKDVCSNDNFVFLVLEARFSSISCKCTCSIEESCKTQLDENLNFHPNI